MAGPTSYYACEGGVWFAAPNPAGPWIVATAVPKAIYDIPPSCPIHYVTYAYIYGSTPDSVYAGYTPGYNGVYVAPSGMVVYGTGYSYPPVVAGSWWVPCPVTYGFGWGMAVNPYTGFAYGFAAGAAFDCWCQPYWGCYGWARRYGLAYAHVNLNSANFYAHWGAAARGAGSWGYNAYTGREWSAQRAAGFNPYTGAYVDSERRIRRPIRTAPRSVNRGVAAYARPASAGAWNNANVYADRSGTCIAPTLPAGGIVTTATAAGKLPSPPSLRGPTARATPKLKGINAMTATAAMAAAAGADGTTAAAADRADMGSALVDQSIGRGDVHSRMACHVVWAVFRVGASRLLSDALRNRNERWSHE